MIRIFLSLCLLASPAIAAVTNWKCGIDVTYSGTDGTDYKEEYLFFNRKVGVQKQVWIKAATTFTMANNSRNVASTGGGQKLVVGSGAGTGQIRFQFDKEWLNWSWSAYDTNPNYYPLYSAPFTMASLSYESGVPVVGTTGDNGETVTHRAAYYWRGIIDSVGDEWHILRYANDDGADYPPSAISASAVSDGNWFAVVVNPITPALTMDAADATGEYYTTPGITNPLVQKVFDQTTYFQGNVNITLTNINGANISYDINGGSTVNVGAASTVLTQATFSSGSNTLRYWYTATPSVKRTRTMIKNPDFRSAGETHGNLLWYDAAGYAAMLTRIVRAPYAAKYNTFLTRSGNGQDLWDVDGGQGYRLGSTQAAWQTGFLLINAFQGRVLGYNTICSGSTKSYGDYAREMLVENAVTTPQLGFEVFATYSQATQEMNFRGYTDMIPVSEAAVAYDILLTPGVNGYRSDTYANGITPIEDYFISDTLASWNSMQALWIGNFQEIGQGLWGTARATASTVITMAMPKYNTPYYGASGMDGTTTTYLWTPFQTTNYTWKQIFVDHSYTITSYPNGPALPFGWEWVTDDLGLCNASGQWADKIAYGTVGQQGFCLAIYRNFEYMYAPSVTHADMDSFLLQSTSVTGAYYLKKQDGDTPPPPYGPVRLTQVNCLSPRFPSFASNATAYAQSLPDLDENSAIFGIGAMGVYAMSGFYVDTYYGSGSGGDSMGGKLTLGGKLNAQ